VEVLAFLTDSSHTGSGANSSAIGVWSRLRVVYGVAPVNG